MNDITRENVHVIEVNSLHFEAAGVAKTIHHNAKNPVRHGYYLEYQALQRICIAILRAESHYFTRDSNNEVYGVLFDGAWLFEEYINTLVGSRYLHPQNTKGLGRQYLFNNGNGLIYPDFISRSEENRTVADAKYKPIHNIYGRDYLQLVAYMYRFEAAEGYFIYPFQRNIHEHQDRRLSLLSGVGKTRTRDQDVQVIKLGLEIPSGETDFNQFEKLMLEEERKLKDRML